MESKFGYRHILDEHAGDWNIKAAYIQRTWRDLAGWAMSWTLKDPDQASVTGPTRFCYQRRLFLYFIDEQTSEMRAVLVLGKDRSASHGLLPNGHPGGRDLHEEGRNRHRANRSLGPGPMNEPRRSLWIYPTTFEVVLHQQSFDGRPIDVDPGDPGLSAQLRGRLEAWSGTFTAQGETWEWEDPQEKHDFRVEGFRIAAEVQQELGVTYDVYYLDRLLEIPDWYSPPHGRRRDHGA